MPEQKGGASGSMLVIDQVSKTFHGDLLRGPQQALRDLTCTFQRGSCTGLLGPNGAGKTTTIRLILGLLRPDSGSIQLDGAALNVAAKRRLGYMPETNKLPGGLTVTEILLHQLQIYQPAEARTRRSRAARVAEVAATAGLAGHTDKRIAHLSKGMARRLAWAQATIHRPEILILDEPASGLDPLGRRQMLLWIAAEKERGTTIVLCTHELTQILTLCDEYHILRGGRLVASGLLVGGTGQAYVIEVSGLDEASLRATAAAKTLPPWREVRRLGLLLEIIFDDYDSAQQWLQQLLSGGYIITRFGDDRRGLEEDLLAHFEESTDA